VRLRQCKTKDRHKIATHLRLILRAPEVVIVQAQAIGGREGGGGTIGYMAIRVDRDLYVVFLDRVETGRGWHLREAERIASIVERVATAAAWTTPPVTPVAPERADGPRCRRCNRASGAEMWTHNYLICGRLVCNACGAKGPPAAAKTAEKLAFDLRTSGWPRVVRC